MPKCIEFSLMSVLESNRKCAVPYKSGSSVLWKHISKYFILQRRITGTGGGIVAKLSDSWTPWIYGHRLLFIMQDFPGSWSGLPFLLRVQPYPTQDWTHVSTIVAVSLHCRRILLLRRTTITQHYSVWMDNSSEIKPTHQFCSVVLEHFHQMLLLT